MLKTEKEKEIPGVSTIGEAQMQKAVDRVLNTTTHGLDDADARKRITTCMTRAISMSKVRGGDVAEPKKTAIYRFATLLDGCKSFKEIEERCKKAFGDQASFKAINLFKRFDFDWNINFEIPETKVYISKHNPAPIKPEGNTEVDKKPKPDEKLIVKQKEQAEGFLSETIKKLEILDRSLEQLRTEFNNKLGKHTHLDGKAVIITEL